MCFARLIATMSALMLTNRPLFVVGQHQRSAIFQVSLRYLPRGNIDMRTPRSRKLFPDNAEAEAGHGLALNPIVRKKLLYKPVHTVEEQINYMKSKAYHDAYRGKPVHIWYRRNIRGQYTNQPPPRLFCIDKEGRFNLNHACPICRDEYLFFDYRNPALIDQFVNYGSDQPMDILRSGLCRDQYSQLKAAILAAKDHGTMQFAVPYRVFDYRHYYSWWHEAPPAGRLTGDKMSIDKVHTVDPVAFPAHNPDLNTDWDEWWIRHDKFARRNK